MKKGTITIGRSHGGSEQSQEQPIHIEIRDEASGTRFIEVQMSLEAFASALFGLSSQDCSFELRTENVGKIREMKYELIPAPDITCFSDRERQAKQILEPFEIDGWKGRVDDLLNHHCREGGNQRVLFVRYVNAPQPELQTP
jgi:hypothetical protein